MSEAARLETGATLGRGLRRMSKVLLRWLRCGQRPGLEAAPASEDSEEHGRSLRRGLTGAPTAPQVLVALLQPQPGLPGAGRWRSRSGGFVP